MSSALETESFHTLSFVLQILFFFPLHWCLTSLFLTVSHLIFYIIVQNVFISVVLCKCLVLLVSILCVKIDLIIALYIVSQFILWRLKYLVVQIIYILCAHMYLLVEAPLVCMHSTCVMQSWIATGIEQWQPLAEKTTTNSDCVHCTNHVIAKINKNLLGMPWVVCSRSWFYVSTYTSCFHWLLANIFIITGITGNKTR